MSVPPFRTLAFASIAALGFALAPVPAAAISEADRPAIEQMIRDYLLKNPEVLREAIAELEKRMKSADEKRRGEALKENRALLNDSPRGVVIGNPKGDVVLVEFFDYNCSYCKRAFPDKMNLIKADSKLKVVLKEFPVLGQSSVDAARVAIAVRMQDPGKYLEFHQKLLLSRGEVTRDRALAVAKESGLDMARIERDLKSPEINATLEESAELSEKLAISGTPTYVIANEVVPGAVGYAALKGKIDAVRKCGQTTC
ncbi:MAG TPA: DsbA family protein [Pseudolabrys sp.]|nr:DsbA family protein [Pseudolabrys sp.]